MPAFFYYSNLSIEKEFVACINNPFLFKCKCSQDILKSNLHNTVLIQHYKRIKVPSERLTMEDTKSANRKRNIGKKINWQIDINRNIATGLAILSRKLHENDKITRRIYTFAYRRHIVNDIKWFIEFGIVSAKIYHTSALQIKGFVDTIGIGKRYSTVRKNRGVLLMTGFGGIL